jgi:hypothetical protein
MEDKRPIETAYIPTGNNIGFRIAVWQNTVVIEKKEKSDDKWQTTAKSRISKKVQEFLVSRGPVLLEKMDNNRGEEPRQILSYLEDVYTDVADLSERLNEIRSVEISDMTPELDEIIQLIVSAYEMVGGNPETLEQNGWLNKELGLIGKGL